MLYIVATPIGNLKDLSLRAIETLQACEFIIAENPHYSRRLFEYIDRLKINAVAEKTDSFDLSLNPSPRLGREILQFAEHNEQQVVKDLTRRLKTQIGCLITDAGTPGISDPGFRLVRECVKEQVEIVPIPGPSAVITALSASGLPTDKFLFLGFLQKTAFKVVEALETALKADATAIFYESPERILKTLSFINNAFPTAQVVIARELTKLHEEFIRGNPEQVLDLLKNRPSIKGELTVLISFK